MIRGMHLRNNIPEKGMQPGFPERFSFLYKLTILNRVEFMNAIQLTQLASPEMEKQSCVVLFLFWYKFTFPSLQ